ncbi:MAG: hypothetical protein Q8L94_17060 [Parvibaculum sp.]|uniref:hypothetical protein n=1 Tax=Parvibaculum sp. TaxID=2024848 RepID=UPI002730D637|nr:hypothetical protein [Parvibaculum sp.]MDP1628828.1 hypothetical protein [Parvibaculum sp.]MDP2148223.1 hypothetical protein [Parvibaculum sp.]
MDQILPADISRIVIVPPAPAAPPSRGWIVQAWRREELQRPEESYSCASAESAAEVAGKLLAGEKVALGDCLFLLKKTEGRPHAAR